MKFNGKIKRKKHLSASQSIILGFALLILAGTFILMLPVSSASHSFTPFYDALFTATSAACVTGLVVHDTATYWSVFGQAVILVLIQIGGMGVITVAVFLMRISGKKIGILQRATMQEAIAAPQIGGMVELTGFIIKTSLVIETAGAALLMPVFIKNFGVGKGIWYSVFHSVSAFCNAGFDLMGIRQQFSSLTSFCNNYYVSIVIALLIIIGGIGFLTWDDIRKNGLHVKRYKMQSKVVFAVTAVLLVLPFIYFLFVEFSKGAFADMSVLEKINAAAFQAVTPRTAGFNSVDLNMFTESGKFLMIILMLIGGSSGSTAGGMKVTTVGVLYAATASVFKKKTNLQLFKRRIGNETVKVALSILIMYISLFTFGGVFISLIENLPLVTCLFESASAVGTVGLTLGITTSLSKISGTILICLMFLGRVGGLTLIYAALLKKNTSDAVYPVEKIMIG